MIFLMYKILRGRSLVTFFGLVRYMSLYKNYLYSRHYQVNEICRFSFLNQRIQKSHLRKKKKNTQTKIPNIITPRSNHLVNIKLILNLKLGNGTQLITNFNRSYMLMLLSSFKIFSYFKKSSTCIFSRKIFNYFTRQINFQLNACLA